MGQEKDLLAAVTGVTTICLPDDKLKAKKAIEGGSPTSSCDDISETQEVERDQWGSKTEFLFSCISYSIGLGNLWRFPYKCYDNGGGAFLVPYLIFLFIAGMPLYFLELSLGQFSSQGPFGVWNVSRIFVGLGYAMVMISFLCSVYYNVIVAWILHYLFFSLKALVTNDYLPWEKCQEPEIEFDNINSTLPLKKTCEDMSQRYWKEQVLQETDDIADFGGIQYELLVCFIIAWIMICLILIKGVKSSGKITYFTALFPYCVIACLLWRGLTLKGASVGLKYYLAPKWEKLLEPEVWNNAASQIFYSLGLGFGSLTTLASYSPFKNNTVRMTLIVTCVNCATSIVAGIVIFAVIGSLATALDKPVEEVVSSGPGLAFVVYPDAVTKMPFAAVWSSLFFFMLLNLGFGSQIAMVETVITAVVDRIPSLLRHKWMVCVAVCLSMFIFGLPMISRSGIYWLNFMDFYSCSYSLFVICFVEVIALVYVYGGDRILTQIQAMVGYRPCFWWLFTWRVTAPISIFGIFVVNMWFYQPMEYPQGHVIPLWTERLGWILAMTSVIMIPALAIVEIVKVPGSFLERLDIVTKPNEEYRPQSHSDFKLVEELFEQNDLPKLSELAVSTSQINEEGSVAGANSIAAVELGSIAESGSLKSSHSDSSV